MEDFGFMHVAETDVEPKKFQLHNHRDQQEIYIFLRGDAEFVVEGTIYRLHPYDIIIAQSFEMHHVRHRDLSFYERMVISVDNSFFVKNNCEKYKEIFVNRPLGVNNRISSETLKAFELPQLLKRIEDYYFDDDDEKTAVRAAIIELLYILNKAGNKTEKSAYHNEHIKEIILYINEHLKDEISLDEITSEFYISKGHLCRSFKKHTGYTVNQYITYKRLMLARELVTQGMSWLEASENAGFGSYSSFYKVFCRTYGHSPSGR